MPENQLYLPLDFRNLCYDLVDTIQNGFDTNSTAILFLSALSTLAIVSVVPRFIISIRELYDRDLRGRWEGSDAGFGVLSRPAANGTVIVSAIAFAEVNTGQNQVVEGDTEDAESTAGSRGDMSQVVEDDAGPSEVIQPEALDRARLV